MKKLLRVYAVLVGLFFLGLISASANPVYSIDIDTKRTGGDPNTNAVFSTETGFSSLDVTVGDGNSATLTLDGIVFQPFSSDSSRVRLTGGVTPDPNALTSDFLFDDGANQAVGLYLGGPGDLQAGTWQVEMWVWDQTSGLDDVIAAFRTGATIATKSETIVGSNFIPDPVNPAATFTFVSDGVSAYDVFVRENNTQNRSRLNAVRLTYIPEPSSMALFLVGCGLLARRRK